MNSRVRAALIVGAIYCVSGIVFAELDDGTMLAHVRYWRLVAWATSAIAFALHICYDHFRLRQPARATALHASLAVALGASALAISALVRALGSGTGNPRLLAIAIVVWPVIATVPAFLVALTTATVLSRWRPRP